MSLQEKIDKAMTGLTRCRNQDGLACFGCPYLGERDCLDMAIRDALLILERMRGGDHEVKIPTIGNLEVAQL